MNQLPPETRAWLDQPALNRLWDRLHDRLEGNGLKVRGSLRLSDVTGAEREAISLLMGRVLTGGRVTVSLPALDEQLRSSAGGRGLLDVITELRGTLTDRPAARDARRAATETLWSGAHDALREHRLDTAPWARPWLDELRQNGTITRLSPPDAGRLIAQAVQALAALHPPPPGRLGRGELAERVTGTAHGLDDGTLLARMVLRALARSHGLPAPADAAARRDLWDAAGVTSDRVSTTVLTFGLAPIGDDWPIRHLRERTAEGAETHLTLRDLNRMTWHLPSGTEVYVCENPRIVEAAADAACSRPLVCVSGNPTTVTLTLLDALTSAGAELAYRGDFDWPGIAIARRMIRRYQARPWRMTAADYEEHVAAARDRGTPLPPLTGTPVEAPWDKELTPAMRTLGVAVQEESALDLLLADLR